MVNAFFRYNLKEFFEKNSFFLISEVSAQQNNSLQPWLGVFVLDHENGAYVDSVTDRSAAEAAGILPGDIVTEFLLSR